MAVNFDENQDSILDLFLALALNLKLLILIPIVIGLLAFGLASQLPKRYTSSAVIFVPDINAEEVAAGMLSAKVLSPLVADVALRTNRSHEVVNAELLNKISITQAKDGRILLNVIANSAADSKYLADALIDGWIKSTEPTSAQYADREGRLRKFLGGLASAGSLLRNIADSDRTALSNLIEYSDGKTVKEISNKYTSHLIELLSSLKGISRDAVVRGPSLPSMPSGPSEWKIAAMAMLVAEFFLILGILARRAWEKASQNPFSLQKQNQIRIALGFRQ